MGKFIDLTGKKFWRWEVMSKSDVSDKSGVHWNCRCECGTERLVPSNRLRNGNSKSCGCRNIENVIKKATKHGMFETRLYRIWRNMKKRCNNPNAQEYHRYGGRGIKVYEGWVEFSSFSVWALNNGYSEILTLDRIDNNGDYCPENCRWVDRMTQQNNMSSNRYITIEGETKTVSQWARIADVCPTTMIWRLEKGWTGTDLIKPSSR